MSVLLQKIKKKRIKKREVEEKEKKNTCYYVISYVNCNLLQFELIEMICFSQLVELWTGKQLFGVLVRPSAQMRVYGNHTVMEKSYQHGIERLCPMKGLSISGIVNFFVGKLVKLL